MPGPGSRGSQMDASARNGLTRRSFLRTAGAGAATFSLAAFLAACGGDGEGGSESGGLQGASGFDWASQKQTGEVTMANWPYYIDQKRVNGQVTHPTLDGFTKATGIDVEYLEQITSYEEFHAKIIPLLQNDQPTGYDVIVTGFPKWFPLLISRGDLIELDHALPPTFDAHVAPKDTDVPYDPATATGSRSSPG